MTVVTIAIDPGTTAGVAVALNGELRWSQTIHPWKDTFWSKQIPQHIRRIANLKTSRVDIVCEFPVGRFNTVKVGVVAGIVIHGLLSVLKDSPKLHYHKPDQWRKIYGCKLRGLSSEQWKAKAQQYVKENHPGVKVASDDEAEAIVQLAAFLHGA